MVPPKRKARAPVKTSDADPSIHKVASQRQISLEGGASPIGPPYEKDKDNARLSKLVPKKATRAKGSQLNGCVTGSKGKEADEALESQIKMLDEDDRSLIKSLLLRLVDNPPLEQKSVRIVNNSHMTKGARRCMICRSSEHVRIKGQCPDGSV
jgi:hypothetical protein